MAWRFGTKGKMISFCCVQFIRGTDEELQHCRILTGLDTLQCVTGELLASSLQKNYGKNYYSAQKKQNWILETFHLVWGLCNLFWMCPVFALVLYGNCSACVFGKRCSDVAVTWHNVSELEAVWQPLPPVFLSSLCLMCIPKRTVLGL